MTPELQAIAATQGGAFLRRQATACGYTKREIEWLLRTREWVRLRWGAYAHRTLVESLDEAGRYLLLVRGSVLRFSPPMLVTHHSASALHGLPLWGTDLQRVHVTRPELHSGRKRAGVIHHEASVWAEDCVVVDGVPCTSLCRTAVDVAREYGFDAGVVAADAALRRGADHTGMLRLARSMRDWPRSPRVLQVVRFADGGADTPGESLTRIFLMQIGFPRPQTQVVVRHGAFVARVDLLVSELRWVIEFDGRAKYRRTRDDCDAAIDDADVVWAEKRREDVLRDELGYAVSRIVWADLFGSRRAETAQRLWAKAERLGAPKHWRRGA